MVTHCICPPPFDAQPDDDGGICPFCKGWRPGETTDSGDSIACPHCGTIHRDLWDHEWGNNEDIETECGECERPFTLSRRVRVDYTARPMRRESESK